MPRESSALQKNAQHIAQQVRRLRRERHLTQVELGQRLGLSQSRLSEIEQGGGSFTAEQFLVILQLFNVPLSFFVAEPPQPDDVLQNALARLGALHLHETTDTLPSERLSHVTDAVRETLVDAKHPRLTAALAPVIVHNIQQIQLPKLDMQLTELGLGRRFAWLLDNVLAVLRVELAAAPPRAIATLYRGASLRLSSFLDTIRERSKEAHAQAPDILDATLRSKRSVEDAVAASSDVSRRWNVVTALQPQDFAEALRASHVSRR